MTVSEISPDLVIWVKAIEKQLQDNWCSSLQNGWRRGNTLSLQKLSKERAIWAMSWDYFSSFINSFSDTHAQPSNGASCLNFGRTLLIATCIVNKLYKGK